MFYNLDLNMNDTVLKLENISKIYKLYDHHIDRLKEAFHPTRKKFHKDFYALKNINLNVRKGETVGIVGENGSGKSTLLKILTDITSPSTGKIQSTGKISAILELGGGFNPEYTGIENIYFNGAILGFSRHEMDVKLDGITDFADIGEFIHQPVKIYSSGMLLRLAFALSINVDPDILIIDEALAVGDIRFQQKCLRKLRSFKEEGKTIVFVSHDIGMIVNYCDIAVWLKQGETQLIGYPEDVTREYSSNMHFNLSTNVKEQSSKVKTDSYQDDLSNIEWQDVSGCSSYGGGEAEITGVALYSKDPFLKLSTLKGSKRVLFCIHAKILSDILTPAIGIRINDRLGNSITEVIPDLVNQPMDSLKAGQELNVAIEFDFPPLRIGDYTVSPAIADGTLENHFQQHYVYDAYSFKIENDDPRYNLGQIVVEDVKIKIDLIND